MDQKNQASFITSPPPSASVPAAEWESDELSRVLTSARDLDEYWFHEFPFQKSLTGLTGLKRLASAMTILLMDGRGTTPRATYERMQEVAPDLCQQFGEDFLVALCRKIQVSEIQELASKYQQMFDGFNVQYFGGRLPHYRIRVVYDLRYWQTEHSGYPERLPPLCGGSAFVDLRGRQIFIRLLESSSEAALTMSGLLIHEMAHAATSEGHGDAWQSEMAWLERLGARVDEFDREYNPWTLSTSV